MLKQYQPLQGHAPQPNPVVQNPGYDVYNSTIMVRLGPLHPSLLANLVPSSLKRPRVEKYEVLADPRDHVSNFLVELQWLTFKDDILYKAFLGTLKGSPY